MDESASITLDLLNESRKGAPGSAKAKAQEAYSDIRKAGWNDTIWGGSQVKKKKGAKDPRKAAYARVVLRHRLADFKKKKGAVNDSVEQAYDLLETALLALEEGSVQDFESFDGAVEILEGVLSDKT